MNNKVKDYIDKNKNNAYIQSTITLAALIVFIAFAIRPTVVNALHTNSDLQKYKDINGQFESKIQILTDAKALHNSYNDEIELIKILIPSNAEEGNLINLIGKIASKNNLSIGKISFDHNGESFENGIKSLDFSISLEGRYEDLFNFTEDIKSTERLMKINSLTIQTKGSNSAETYIKADMTGTTYYKIRPKKDVERNNDN